MTGRPLRRYCVVAILAVIAHRGSSAALHGAQDIYVINAKIWTNDPVRPTAGAMHIRDGAIVAVGNGIRPEPNGSDRKDLDKPVVVDAKGARVVPGLIDAHLHLLGGGLQLSRLNLRDVPNRAAFIAAVAERAKATPKGHWITGGRWSTESWPDPSQPIKSWIDPATGEHPVLLSRMDGHGALANSAALRIAGIDRKGPPDPPGGAIERDPVTGEPTGILKDTAIELVSKHVPRPSDAELDAALAAAQVEAHRHGITCVHTMSEYHELAPIDRARAAGTLSLRVRFYISEDNWEDYLDKANAHKADDMVRVRGFKQYADGSLGSRSAYMAKPFADNPHDNAGWRGLPRAVLGVAGQTGSTPGRVQTPLEQECLGVSSIGLSLAVHAIGDQANHLVLDTYERVQGAARHRQHSEERQSATRALGSSRHRIEHAQHLLPADIGRFSRLGVVASMQPYHKADDARYAEKAIGPERCKTSYAFRSLLDAGAPLAFGSDWPVVSLNPFLGIHAAVTGRSLDGKVFVPEQNITVEESLRAYTSGAAWAAGDENRLGKLAPGYTADFVLLEEDPLAIAAEDLESVRVTATYVAGQCVWSR
ncbi:MAG: amidohydrolase [Planctomycetota bacterium]|nr:MAG: amidohydrolase [Planctomycetota bacterium]